jgi:Glycosyltransferase family 87
LSEPKPFSESVRRSLELFVCVVLPFALPTWILITAWRADKFAVDFDGAFWPAARTIVTGGSPYAPNVHFGTPFVYPVPAALLFAPFGLLPRTIASLLFVLLLMGAAILTLRVLRIDDWRCYAAAATWPPVLFALQTANVTLVLALCLAVLWRIRDRPWPAAVVVALLITLKLFLWPLAVWLAARHGVRRGLLSFLLAAGVALVAWAGLGFSGLAQYPHVMAAFERAWGPTTYSVLALGLRIGLSASAAHALLVCLGGVVLVAAIARERRFDDDASAFAAIIVAAVLLSAVVWLHYLALFLVPVALLRPRLGIVWFAPLLLWLCPDGLTGPSWYAAVLLGACATVMAIAALPNRRPKDQAALPVRRLSLELRASQDPA